ncbi:hypothetical protein Emtol_1531 [Emticicia oligotrophica DSM 17448]|uniref:Uncharacterized protein n=1 Tax=Emticicia oligotrophica (strain DSM 17448 / CIP 109782 / MTCC 6937 / GPTSA100-15) TaxID=929562 RepID=A0ABM5N086_EMTOG|nr:hypothetical protein [Emticicia oligotrophica]AFK02677.1 hypothetical protein Emtol_1531 [Emticicia oligotrophica DSM 17448]
MQTTTAPLSPLQLELLKSFSQQSVTEQDLIQIKILLSKFFAQKASKEAQKVIETKGLSKAEVNQLAEQHQRTPYKTTK